MNYQIVLDEIYNNKEKALEKVEELNAFGFRASVKKILKKGAAA